MEEVVSASALWELQELRLIDFRQYIWYNIIVLEKPILYGGVMELTYIKVLKTFVRKELGV